MTDEAPKAPAFPTKTPAAAPAPEVAASPPPMPPPTGAVPDGSGPTAVAAATGDAGAAAEAAPASDPDVEDKPKVPIIPQGWGDPNKRTAPKRWNEGSRSDDPTVRTVHAPLQPGIGDGKAFLFLFGFKRAAKIDQGMLARELGEIDDDVQLLRNAGYTVVVDPQATREDFINTVTGQGEGVTGLIPAGFYWSAHGHYDGGLECCDGGMINPADIDTTKVSPGLRVAILGACYVGSRSKTWQKALGGKVLVVGWGRPVTIDRAVDFLAPDDATSTDLDDLVKRWLLTDEALPIEAEDARTPAPASSLGKLGDLAERIKPIAEMLGARWRERTGKEFGGDGHGHIQLEVPLPDGRTHFVEAFLFDSTEPFCEGEVLLGVEATVGEISALVTPQSLLAGLARPGFGRIALVKSETEMPKIVTQSFVSYGRSTDQHLAAHLYQCAVKADSIEKELFGTDAG